MRKINNKNKKIKYILKYLEIKDNPPIWHIYECRTYDEMKYIIKEYHNKDFTRDILQNIYLKRGKKKDILYPYIEISKYESDD
jgi:hypothetical protein